MCNGDILGGGDGASPWVFASLPESCRYLGRLAAGTAAGGWRIIHTMGSKITKLQPVGGFAAETGAATAQGSPAITTPASAPTLPPPPVFTPSTRFVFGELPLPLAPAAAHATPPKVRSFFCWRLAGGRPTLFTP